MRPPRHDPHSTRSVVLVSCLAGAGSVQAQSPAAIRLTLDDAIARGLDTSHRLAEIRAREQGAQAAVRGAQAADKPIVSATAGYMRTNHVPEFFFLQPSGARLVVYPDIPDNVVTRFALQWPIYTSGRTDALERAASAEAQADCRRHRNDPRGSAAGDRARVLGGRDRARSGQGARGSGDAGRRAGQRLEAAVRCRVDPAERGVESRSAAIARARAVDRGEQHPRIDADRSPAAHRRGSRHRHRARGPARCRLEPAEPDVPDEPDEPDRSSRRRWAARAQGADLAPRRAGSAATSSDDRQQAEHRIGRRRGLLEPEPAFLPAPRQLAEVVGRFRQCELAVL